MWSGFRYRKGKMGRARANLSIALPALLFGFPACGSSRSSDGDGSPGTDADGDTDSDSDPDTDADTDSDSDTGTGAGDCPVFFGADALQGWFENSQDYQWTFEANVWDVDGEDDVVAVTATLEDPDTGDPLYAVDLGFVDSASTWQGYALQADIGLDCCQVLYDVRFVATDAANCATEFETTVVNDEP
jgi:hypothetical protein